MEECCLYILKLLDSGLKLQNPMLEASRQSSNSNLIIIALSNLLLAVNPRSGIFLFLTAISHRGLRNSFFLRYIYFSHILFGLLFPFSIWTFISLFYLDFYFYLEFYFTFLPFFNSIKSDQIRPNLTESD